MYEQTYTAMYMHIAKLLSSCAYACLAINLSRSLNVQCRTSAILPSSLDALSNHTPSIPVCAHLCAWILTCCLYGFVHFRNHYHGCTRIHRSFTTVHAYKEELNPVVRKLLACMQPNNHKSSTALWNPYR